MASDLIRRLKRVAICQHCRKPFRPFSASKGIFCSNDCKFSAKKLATEARRTRTCPGCGVTFVAFKADGKYCTNECYQEAKKNRPLMDRLLESINKTDYCWLWSAGCNSNGYGRIFYGGQFLLVHRAMYALTTGEDITDKAVRHLVCDNPPCCRPDHLKSGTKKQNSQDAVRKARHAHGETTYAKLSEADVRAIFDDPRIQRIIAADYGVSRRAVGHIKNGTTWKHLKLR